ncbi:hypothetical protein THASP1DRAFT_28397 [Thamnocephalis sphaerospora]|uniref:Uncharacterized protein n=1 Tax=Thamnocephalis sphaerospora TaxID=78915 RepID=A0A4P9XWN0_9FUNG|nr:hypothetical protein THASP1DRAFT_28397 [Thamnocephalis sphaerospora]|eukprot:RKP09810.1 hypothetical protein THASP1DRAFT_28397 [Thamnocephalis sphaerospora]
MAMRILGMYARPYWAGRVRSCSAPLFRIQSVDAHRSAELAAGDTLRARLCVNPVAQKRRIRILKALQQAVNDDPKAPLVSCIDVRGMAIAKIERQSSASTFFQRILYEQPSVIVMDLVPSVSGATKSLILCDGARAGIISLKALKEIPIAMLEILASKDILKVTLRASNIALACADQKPIPVANIVGLDEIFWPGSPQGYGPEFDFQGVFTLLLARELHLNDNVYREIVVEKKVTPEYMQSCMLRLQAIILVYQKLCEMQHITSGPASDCGYVRHHHLDRIIVERVNGFLPSFTADACQPDPTAIVTLSVGQTALHSTGNGTAALERTETIPAMMPTGLLIQPVEGRVTVKQLAAALEAGGTAGKKSRVRRGIKASMDINQRTIATAMRAAFSDIFDQMEEHKRDAASVAAASPDSEATSAADLLQRVMTNSESLATLTRLLTVLDNPTRCATLHELLNVLEEGEEDAGNWEASDRFASWKAE